MEVYVSLILIQKYVLHSDCEDNHDLKQLKNVVYRCGGLKLSLVCRTSFAFQGSVPLNVAAENLKFCNQTIFIHVDFML